MRYNPGAESYIRGLSLPQSVLLKAEKNAEASGGIAYAVYHRGNKLAYIREADLPTLKREAATAKYSTALFIDIVNKYEITQQYPNYLVIKLAKNTSTTVNPCAEIYLQDNVCTSIGVNTSIGADTVYASVVNPLNKTQTKKEETMFDKIVNANKTIAVTGAYMEAGRIANNQVTKIVAAKAPLMVKGYIDTPIGKVVLANLTMMAVDQFRPTDVKLKKVANAMGAVAYQELIQTIDIEGMLNELTSSEGIKAALAAVAGQEEVAVKA